MTLSRLHSLVSVAYAWYFKASLRSSRRVKPIMAVTIRFRLSIWNFIQGIEAPLEWQFLCIQSSLNEMLYCSLRQRWYCVLETTNLNYLHKKYGFRACIMCKRDAVINIDGERVGGHVIFLWYRRDCRSCLVTTVKSFEMCMSNAENTNVLLVGSSIRHYLRVLKEMIIIGT